ncbi:MOSC domain-containing protein [Rubritalea sp.]|uniref:MOSC domain-containing protein n=1 Tax=Rubritalea sp. TaxID=2109375 RepID=UPI003EF7F772
MIYSPKVLSIQTGKIENFQALESSYLSKKEWSSAINKKPITSPSVKLTKFGIEGDEHADELVHGGCDKAICVYPSEHLPYWEKALGLELKNGGFGENFTTVRQLETMVCIGDTYRVGSAILEVTQPRQPCWKLAKRYDLKELALRVQETGKTGWYLRVLEKGNVEPNSIITLVDRPSPHWSIDAVNQLMHHQKSNYSDMISLLHECPALAASWHNTFETRITRRASENETTRHEGNQDLV